MYFLILYFVLTFANCCNKPIITYLLDLNSINESMSAYSDTLWDTSNNHIEPMNERVEDAGYKMNVNDINRPDQGSKESVQ